MMRLFQEHEHVQVFLCCLQRQTCGRNVNFAQLTDANFLTNTNGALSHAEAGSTDEGEHKGGEPGQHHVWAAAGENLLHAFF